MRYALRGHSKTLAQLLVYPNFRRLFLARTPGAKNGNKNPKNTWKRDLKKEMWSAGYKYRWRKMEAAAQYRARCGRVWSMVYVSPAGIVTESSILREHGTHQSINHSVG